MSLRAQTLQAIRDHAIGHIEKHKLNVEVYLTNPAGIGEHPDIVQAVDSELVKLSTAEDKLASLESNYPQHTPEYLAEKYAQGNLFDKDDAIEGE